jgi:hypothetical protein
MHGEVRVIANITNAQVFGLTQQFDQNYFVNQSTYAVDACRNACYSNIECAYWQYSKTSGCWTESPDLSINPRNAQMVPYPVTYAAWTSQTPEAPNFIAGEYIQHVCPGFNHIPANFSLPFVPDHLQYGPRGAHDPVEQAMLRYRKEFPNARPAPPIQAPIQRFSVGRAPVAQGPGSWSPLLLSACGFTILFASAIVAVRRHRSRMAEAMLLEGGDDEEDGVDALSQGLVE